MLLLLLLLLLLLPFSHCCGRHITGRPRDRFRPVGLTTTVCLHITHAHTSRTHTHTHTHTHTQHNTTHTHPHNTRTHHLLLLSTHTRCAAGVSKDCVTAISPLTCRRPEDGRDAVPKGICLVPANRNQHVRQEHRPCKARWQPCCAHRVWTVCPVFGPSS